jgi:hypothetical protein
MASPGKWFKLFFRDPEKRRRMFNLYIHHKNIYCKGESEIGFIRHVLGFQSVAVYYLVAEKVSDRLGMVIPMEWIACAIPVAFSLKIIIYYSVGWLWDHFELFDAEHTWGNKRDPILKVLSEKLLDSEGLEWIRFSSKKGGG